MIEHKTSSDEKRGTFSVHTMRLRNYAKENTKVHGEYMYFFLDTLLLLQLLEKIGQTCPKGFDTHSL